VDPHYSQLDLLSPNDLLRWVIRALANQIGELPASTAEALSEIHFIWEVVEQVMMRHFVAHNICSYLSPAAERKRRYRKSLKRAVAWN